MIASAPVARGRLVINPLAGIYHGKTLIEAVSMEKLMVTSGVIIPLEQFAKSERLEFVEHMPYFVPCTYGLKDGGRKKCLYVHWLFDYVRDKGVHGPAELERMLLGEGFYAEPVSQLMHLLRENEGTFVFPVPENLSE
jgi:hypothetical protein